MAYIYNNRHNDNKYIIKKGVNKGEEEKEAV